jgi:tRNA G18 (ribose-2'-O)-methylase SpoU
VVRKTGQVHIGGGTIASLGEHDAQNLGSPDGILIECFVKIAHSEQQQGVGVFGLDAIVLLHQWRFLFHGIFDLCAKISIRVQKLSNQELGRPDLIAYQQKKKLNFVLVLDQVRSALNVGSIFRTADAFLVQHLYLCGITACPPHREIEKTALGATASVPWSNHADTLSLVMELKNKGYAVFALEQAKGSISLSEFPAQQKPLAIVLGHEMDGVSQAVIDACDGCIEIMQEGTKHSLNVAVCAGIVTWEAFQRICNRE